MHICDRTDKFEAMGLPDAQSCDMKDLQDAMQDMLEIQRSSPAQDLAHTMSVVGQTSQDGNQAKPKSSSSYALFTRSGVPVFKYSDSEPSQVLANSSGQCHSSGDILAWANDVVGGDGEECRFRANKSGVFMIKGLIPLVYFRNMFSEKYSN